MKIKVSVSILAVVILAGCNIFMEEKVDSDSAPSGTFTTVWKTDNLGMSMDNQIIFPIDYGGKYNFTISWGDGTSDTIQEWDDSALRHTYSDPGTYTVEVEGQIEGFTFAAYGYNENNEDPYRGDSQKLLEISEWGPVRFGNNSYYFQGCKNLVITALDMPDLTGTTNLNGMFTHCHSMTDIPNIENWDVSAVTNMTYVFGSSSTLNPNISSWDVSSVTNFNSMFAANSAFNRDIGGWDVSSAQDMKGMFNSTVSFNQDIGDWDVSSVTDFSYMFAYNTGFNQDIGGWDVSKAQTMRTMFCQAMSFNQDLGDWNVSSVTDMEYMFFYALAFNQNLGRWDISNVQNMGDIFRVVELSTENYDAILNGWSSLPSLQPNVEFHGGYSQYSSAASAARQSLIDDYNWTIDDGGEIVIP